MSGLTRTRECDVPVVEEHVSCGGGFEVGDTHNNAREISRELTTWKWISMCASEPLQMS